MRIALIFTGLIATLYLGFWLGGIFHETGHFLCGKVAGFAIRMVRAGSGPILARWQLWDTSFEVRLLPVGGFAKPGLISQVSRARMAFFMMGGVIGNATFLALILLVETYLDPKGVTYRFVQPLEWLQYGMIALSLLPYRAKQMPSDGLWLVFLLFGKRAELERSMTSHNKITAR